VPRSGIHELPRGDTWAARRRGAWSRFSFSTACPVRPFALGSCTERTLSGTALNLSEVRLGAMTWREQNTEPDARAARRRALCCPGYMCAAVSTTSMPCAIA